MDAFARSLLIAENILQRSTFKIIRSDLYAIFDMGDAIWDNYLFENNDN
jgi:hypothetical protein